MNTYYHNKPKCKVNKTTVEGGSCKVAGTLQVCAEYPELGEICVSPK